MQSNFSLERISAIREFFTVLSSRQLWTPQFALFAVSNYAIAFFVVDVIPRQADERWWALVAEFICIVIMLLLGALVRKILLTFAETQSQSFWLNIGLATMVLIVTNAIGSPILHLPNAFDWQLLVRDTTIGFFGGGYIALMYVSLLGAQQLRVQALTRLEHTRDALTKSIEVSQRELANYSNLLMAKTAKYLFPQLKAIKALLHDSARAAKALAKLQGAVRKDIEQLASGQPNYVAKVQTPAIAETAKRYVQAPVNFKIDLKPLRIWLTVLPGLVLFLIVVYPGANIFLGCAFSLALLALLQLLRVLATNQETRPAIAAFIMFALCASYAAIANATAPLWDNGEAHEELFWSLLYGVLMVALTNTFVNANSRQNSETAETLAELNEELQAKNDTLNRNLWVLTMKWHALLHSQIQSLITRNILRIAMKAKLSKETREEIYRDLETVSSVIESSSNAQFDLIAAIGETARTWQSACVVKTKFGSGVRQRLSDDQGLAFVLNELIKELTTNLYSQLDAKRVDFSVTMLSDSQCQFTASTQNSQSKSLNESSLVKLNLLAPTWQSAQIDEKFVIKAVLASSI